MRSFKFRVSAVAVALLAACAFAARAVNDQPAEMPDEGTMEAMQAAMQAYAEVRPEHEQLKKHFAGTWDAQVTFFMGPEPQTSTGTMKTEPIFGGRFLRGEFEGEFEGEAFQGISYTGFDNARRKYISTWTDSMSTGIMFSEGTYDSASRTYTFIGESVMPDGPRPCRQVVRIEGDDKHVFEMHMPGMDGKEMRVMEIVYTRK